MLIDFLILKVNGKEFPKNNFEKFTAKPLVAKIRAARDSALKSSEPDVCYKSHTSGSEIYWQ